MRLKTEIELCDMVCDYFYKYIIFYLKINLFICLLFNDQYFGELGRKNIDSYF